MSTGKKTFSIPTLSEMKKKATKNPKPSNEGPLSEEKVTKLRMALDWLEEQLMTDRFENAVMRAMNNTNPHRSKEQAILLAFSAQRRQGENYRMYTFVKYDPTNTDEPFQFVNMRPENHDEHIWYFNLVYLVLGGEVKQMGNRSLNHPDNLKLGLKPVMSRLRENAELKEKGYEVTLQPFKNRESGVVEKWILKVHWGEDKDRVLKFRQEQKGSSGSASASASAPKPKPAPPKPEDFSATLEESKQKANAKPKITQKKD